MDLKSQRRSLGLTQHRLAREAGLPYWRVAFSETDRIKLTDQEVLKIKTVLERRAKKVLETILAA